MTRTVPDAAVQIHNVKLVFNRWGQAVPALSGVTLDVMSNDWVLLVGHNGAGKSSLLKVIAGQLKPQSGHLLICGQRIENLSPTKLAQCVFTVHQDPLLGTAPLLTVLENLRVADLDAHKSPKARGDPFANYTGMLESIGLAARLKQPVKLLSGGERQLLALVIASIRQAPIILLDEPLAALDPNKVELCIGLISRLHQAGKTIIQVTHDLRSLRKVADRVVTMQNGLIIHNEILKSASAAQA